MERRQSVLSYLNIAAALLLFFLAGCSRNNSIFFSKDLPEPLKPRSKALTVSSIEGDPPATMLYSSIHDNDLK